MGTSKRMRNMYKHYGMESGKRCARCCNYQFKESQTKRTDINAPHICIAYGEANGSDCIWDGESFACGLYNRPFLGMRPSLRPLSELYEAKKRYKSIEDTVQLTMDNLFLFFPDAE